MKRFSTPTQTLRNCCCLILLCLALLAGNNNANAQCTTIAPDPTNSAWTAIANPTCSQQGPISGQGANAYTYHSNGAMANCYMDWYLATAGTVTCANVLYYAGGDVGPVIDCRNFWNTSLAPAGTSYVKCVVAGTWAAGTSTVLYYKYATPGTPTVSSFPTSVCINTATTYTANAVGSTLTGVQSQTGYVWAVSGVSASYSTSTSTPTQNITFTTAGTATVSVYATNNGVCNSGTLSVGSIVVKPNQAVTLASGSATPASFCISTALPTNTVYNTNGGTTGASAVGIPTGMTGTYSGGTGGTFTIAGTPSVSGSFPYTVTTSGTCGSAATTTGTITVKPNQAITLASGSATPAGFCINTALPTNTVYNTNAGTTGASAAGLPTGMSGTYSGGTGGTFTISGTPSVAGSFPYTITTSGTCGSAATTTGTITVIANQTIGLLSGATSPTGFCINTALPTNTVFSTNSSVTGASAVGLPTGMSGVYGGGTGGNFTISGTPSVSGSFPYTVTTSGSCNAAQATGTITVYANHILGLTTGVNSPTLCIGTALGTNTVYTASGGATGISSTITAGSGMSFSVSGTTFTISGTPTISGSYPYTITTTGTGSCSPQTVTGTVTVTPNQTIAVASGVASPAGFCVNTALPTNTVFSTNSSVTGASAVGLPTGMSGGYSGGTGGTFTISGTPSVSGSFPYTVTTSGSCNAATATGTITVYNTHTLTLSTGANSPTVCKNTALGTATVYTAGGGATGLTLTGTGPAGMTFGVSGTTFTISGTPTVAGSFPYTITTTGTGSCSPQTVTGSLTVYNTQSMSVTGGAANSSVCKNTALGTNIVFTFGGGATSAGISAGTLPAGMIGGISGSTFVISGTPTVSGSFPYTVTSSGAGSCSPVDIAGTITVNNTQSMTVTGGAANSSVCKNSALSPNIVFTFGGGATSASITGALPAGMSGGVSGSTFVISGTPTVAGSFPYTVTSSGTGACSPVSIAGTITVNDIQTMTQTSGTSTTTLCQNTLLSPTLVYTFGGGATSASISAGALPAGMSGGVSGSTFVISGTPSAAGSFPYTVTTSGTGGCSPVDIAGIISVTATPTPTFTTSPSSPACNFTNVTYTTQAGKTNYTWLGFGTAGVDYNIISGGLSSTDNTVTLQWIGTGTKAVTVGYTASGCPSATPASSSIIVNASPTPSVSNSGAYCTSNTIVYSTASGQSNYVWLAPGSTTPADYTVIAGGTSTDNTWTLQWNTTGSKTVTANYTNAAGCPGPTAGSNTGTVANGPTSATIADVIDGCNGGHTATVTVSGGTSPYNFTVCGTPYTGQTSPFALDATSNTSCSLSTVSDANGCVPGTIIGSPVGYPTRTLTTGDTYACMVSTGATKIFYDNTGNLMAKIIDAGGGAGLGSTTVIATVDATVQKYGPVNKQSYLQRHFKITPTNATAATVCLYLSNAEVGLLHDSSGTDNHSAPSYYPTVQTNLSNAVVTKFSGGSETPLSNTSRQVLTLISKTPNPVVNGVTYNNVWEVCMNVTTWSGFYLHGQNTNNTPLPVTFLYLTADAVDNKYIQLDWATASEINNQGFEIQRSTDGVTFSRLGFVDGHGNSNSTLTYSYDDKTAQPGAVYYYRLKQVDVDGQFAFTEIVSASLIGDKGFVFEDLIPNPAINNSVQLGVLTTAGQKTTVTVTDMLGRIVMTTPWQLAEGYNISTFDISALANGAYNVTVYSGTTYTTKRLVVAK